MSTWSPEAMRFFELEIEHDNLIVARDHLFRHLDSPVCANVVAFIGAPGVGKTTLIQSSVRKVLADNATAMDANPLLLPAYYLEMAEDGAPQFNIADFYEEHINAVCLRDVQPNVEYPDRAARLEPGDYIKLTPRRNWAKIYRSAWIKVMKHRGITYVFLDEAVIFFKASDETLIKTRGNIIRAIAAQAHVVIILVGGFDLLDKIHANPDLRRRCAFVEFTRYNADKPKDLECLYKILRTFSEALPFDRSVDLHEFAPYLIQRSFGCTGIMKAIIDMAVVTALRERAILSRKHFGSASLLERYPYEQYIKMRDQAIAGEARLAEFLGRTPKKKSNAGQTKAPKRRPGQVKTVGNPRTGGRSAGLA